MKRTRGGREYSFRVTVKLGRTAIGDFFFRLFPSIRAMRREFKKGYPDFGNCDRAYGLFVPGPFKHSGRKVPDVGHILLVRTCVGAGYVAHEILHAVVCYAFRSGAVEVMRKDREGGKEKGRRRAVAAEERLAELTEGLTRAFWTEWYEKIEPDSGKAGKNEPAMQKNRAMLKKYRCIENE